MKKLLNKNVYLFLLLIFLLCVLFRSILGILTGTISILYDELIYWDISKSIFSESSIMVRGIVSSNKDILYPLVISWTHFFCDYDTIYGLMIITNTILMSSVIFPTYMLSCAIIGKKNISVFIAICSILVPEMFYTTRLLQENLYYPAVIWVFYAFWQLIIKNKLRPFCVFLFVLIINVLCYIKNIGLCFLLALVFFLVIQIFTSETLKEKFILTFEIIESLIEFLLFKIFFDFIIANLLNQSAGDSMARLSFDALNNLFDLKNLLGYLYPSFAYIFFVILFMGVLVFLIDVSYGRFLTKKDKDFLVYIICVALWILIAVCLLIIEADNEHGEKITRIHYRYFFYLMIPFFIIFCKLYNVIKDIGINCLYIFFSVAYLFLSALIYIKMNRGSTIDSVSANALLFFFQTDFRGIILRFLLFSMLLISIWLIKRHYIMLLYLCFFGMFGMISICSSEKAYRESFNEKIALETMNSDGELLNNYLISQDDIQLDSINDILIVAANKANTGPMETHLENKYRVCQLNDILDEYVWNDGIINYKNLQLYSTYPYYLQNTDEYVPKYIIVQGKIDPTNYNLVNIGLVNFSLYKRSN